MSKIFKTLFLLFVLFGPKFVWAQPSLGLEYGQYTGLSAKDPRAIIASIINVLLSLLGVIALVIILIGGFLWMTSGGNEDQIKKAKKMLTAGVIGLAIILSAYSLARFVLTQLISATTG